MSKKQPEETNEQPNRELPSLEEAAHEIAGQARAFIERAKLLAVGLTPTETGLMVSLSVLELAAAINSATANIADTDSDTDTDDDEDAEVYGR